MVPVRMSGGCFVREGTGRERSRKMTNGPSGTRELKYPEEGSGRNFPKPAERPGMGNEAGQNNSNLAQHEIQVECCGMGTIRNDRSHLCFYLVEGSATTSMEFSLQGSFSGGTPDNIMAAISPACFPQSRQLNPIPPEAPSAISSISVT